MTTLTGRCRTVAAITAATWCARAPLLPNPPPTCSDRTRTEAGSRENRLASSPATQVVPWLESTTSSRPPSHRAVAACGSIGLWYSSGVVYSASTTTADAASCASRSPFSTTAGAWLSSGYASVCRSAENATSCGSSS